MNHFFVVICLFRQAGTGGAVYLLDRFTCDRGHGCLGKSAESVASSVDLQKKKIKLFRVPRAGILL